MKKSFKKYYFNDIENIDATYLESISWRDKYIWHTTETGKRNRVKIKSLPSDEQQKYKPAWLRFKEKIRRSGAKPGSSSYIGRGQSYTPDDSSTLIRKGNEVDINQPDLYLFNFYYGVESQDDAVDFKEDVYIKATDEPSIARELFVDKDNLIVIRASNVPVGAVIQYKEDDEWKTFDEDMTDEEKAEFIEEDEIYMFLLDLLPYKDQIQFNYFKPHPIDNSEENEDLKINGAKEL